MSVVTTKVTSVFYRASLSIEHAIWRWMEITDSDLCEVFPDLANLGTDWSQGFDLFTT